MVVAMNRLLARCSMPGVQRWLLLAVFGLNPLLLFYAGNGMSEVVYLALLTFSLYCFMSWFLTDQPRFLVAAGLAFALLVLLRYSFGDLGARDRGDDGRRARPSRRAERRDRGHARSRSSRRSSTRSASGSSSTG